MPIPHHPPTVSLLRRRAIAWSASVIMGAMAHVG